LIGKELNKNLKERMQLFAKEDIKDW